MANYANLLATIAANIYTNGNNEVTAAMVKAAVDSMVNSLGDGYQFMGIATPATNPSNPDSKQFYIASTPGTYTNFGGAKVNGGEVAILKGSGTSWSKEVMGGMEVSALGILPALARTMTKDLVLRATDGYAVGSAGDFYVSSFIPVTSGEYAFRASKPSNSFLALAGYSAADQTTFVDTFRIVKSSNDNSLDVVTIPAGVNYVRLSYAGLTPDDCQIWPLMADGLLRYYYEALDEAKADKVISRNILDPDTLQDNAYLASSGAVVTIASPSNYVSDFIPVAEGESLVVAHAASSSSSILTFAAYDENKTFLRGVSGGVTSYTQQGKEKFVRIGSMAPYADAPLPFANKGTTLLPYDNYATAEMWYQGTNKPELPTPSVPDYVYCICDDVKQYSLGFYADHLVNLRAVNLQPVTRELLFRETGNDHLNIFAPIAPDLSSYNDGENKLERPFSGTIFGDYLDTPISFNVRSILNSYTKDNPIRVLCIGDSVTAGTGSGYPEEITGGKASQYWHCMHRLCLDDQHNHSTSAYKYLSIGTRNKNEFEYRGATYRDFAEGRGGWAIANYLFDAAFSGADNAFYDSGKVWAGTYATELNDAGVKFSLAKYLASYKTLQDDGVTRLVVGSTAGTQVTDVMAYDVCTPNVVIIQLGHNNSADDYADNMPLLIKAIRNEYPTMKIVLSLADETGAYNVKLYPEFPSDQLLYGYLHGEFVKQIEICKTLEGQFSDLLFCPSGVTQPTAWSTSYKEMPKAESLIGKDFPFNMQIGAGPDYHPSAFAQAAWGYQMLACIKWILS